MHLKDIEVGAENETLLLELEKQLGEVEYQRATPDQPGLAGIVSKDDKYLIHLAEHMTGDPLACHTAHRLIYALLAKEGYPACRPADSELAWQQVLSDSINTLMLELKATDQSQALGFDHSYFFNKRYKEVKDFTAAHRSKSLDSFQSLWFAVDLALTLIFLPSEKINFLLSSLQGKEDESVGLALSIIKTIETIGYHTPGRAFLAMAEISTLLDSWSFCPIYYNDQLINSHQQYISGYNNLRSLLLG